MIYNVDQTVPNFIRPMLDGANVIPFPSFLWTVSSVGLWYQRYCTGCGEMQALPAGGTGGTSRRRGGPWLQYHEYHRSRPVGGLPVSGNEKRWGRRHHVDLWFSAAVGFEGDLCTVRRVGRCGVDRKRIGKSGWSPWTADP
jgi:hypothetical protein